MPQTGIKATKNQITPIYGDELVLFLRVLEEESTERGLPLPLELSNTFNTEMESDSVQTKQGAINTKPTMTETIDMRFIASRTDHYEKIRKAVKNGKKLAVWIVDRGNKQTEGANKDKYPATYAEGFCTGWPEEAEAGEFIEIDTTLNVDGKAQEGFVTLTKEEEENLMYVFKDLDPEGPAGSDPADAGAGGA